MKADCPHRLTQFAELCPVQVEISEIEAVSSAPQVEGQTYFLVKTYADLSEAVNNVSRQLCYWNKILNGKNVWSFTSAYYHVTTF